MKSKIFAAAALSLMLGSAALAQTGTGTGGSGTATGSGAASGNSSGSDAAGTSGMSKMPSSWSGPIGDTFFTDSSGGTLRTQDEMTSRWGSLSSDQQAQVRADCNSYTAQYTTGGKNADGTGTDTGTTSSTGKPSSATGAAGADNMAQLCAWVGGM